MKYFVHIWNSEHLLSIIVSILDYAGVADVITGVVFLIIWFRNKENSDRKTGLIAILLSIFAGILWTLDTTFAHQLTRLQQAESEGIQAQQSTKIGNTLIALSNATRQIQLQSNDLAETSRNLAEARISASNALAVSKNTSMIVSNAEKAGSIASLWGISGDNKNKFIDFLKDAPKGKVYIYVLLGGGKDTEAFAGDVNDMLTRAGYETTRGAFFNPTAAPHGFEFLLKGKRNGATLAPDDPIFILRLLNAFDNIGMHVQGNLDENKDNEGSPIYGYELVIVIGLKP